MEDTYLGEAVFEGGIFGDVFGGGMFGGGIIGGVMFGGDIFGGGIFWRRHFVFTPLPLDPLFSA